MNSQQIARVTGVVFLITYIAIAALPLYSSVLDDPRYILGAGAAAQVRLGAFIEFIVVIANIGTAVVLYPIVKRPGYRDPLPPPTRR
jgi:Na+-transporting methylmalonyl-CoA/oxaloacetate decarboxylase beta subunit